MEKMEIEKVEKILNYLRVFCNAEFIFFLDVYRDTLKYYTTDKHRIHKSIEQIIDEMRERGIDI